MTTTARILVLDGHSNAGLAGGRSLGRAGHSVLLGWPAVVGGMLYQYGYFKPLIARKIRRLLTVLVELRRRSGPTWGNMGGRT